MKNTEDANVDDEDEMMREAIARCWNSGNMVIGNRDDNGNVTISEHPVDRRHNDQPSRSRE